MTSGKPECWPTNTALMAHLSSCLSLITYHLSPVTLIANGKSEMSFTLYGNLTEQPPKKAGRPALLLLCLLTTFVTSSHTLAQEAPTAALLEVEPFSKSVVRSAQGSESTTDPQEILRSVRYIYVRSLSEFVASEDIEHKLRRHPDFKRYGLLITRMEADADLILEVRRSVLTKFVFTAIGSRTLLVAASGKLSSLGGTVDGKVAKLFMKQLVTARSR